MFPTNFRAALTASKLMTKLALELSENSEDAYAQVWAKY